MSSCRGRRLFALWKLWTRFVGRVERDILSMYDGYRVEAPGLVRSYLKVWTPLGTDCWELWMFEKRIECY